VKEYNFTDFHHRNKKDDMLVYKTLQNNCRFCDRQQILPHVSNNTEVVTLNRGTIMLNKAKTLKGYKLDSLDGEIGEIKEFYFDDTHWAIRYLVAETGDWLMDRQVLISPYALFAVNKEEKRIAITIAKGAGSMNRLPMSIYDWKDTRNKETI
jgi:hypothetical protein